MRNFPWQAMIKLGKQAKFKANVILYADDPTKQCNLSLYPETIIRCAIGPHDNRSPAPVIKRNWDIVMVTAHRYSSEFRIYHSCEWLPMFQAFADWQHN